MQLFKMNHFLKSELEFSMSKQTTAEKTAKIKQFVLFLKLF